MGLIPDPRELNSSQCSSSDDLSGISNFSLEIEMLNRMHVENNNRDKLSSLPVLYDNMLPDPSVELYLEEPTEDGRLVFRMDQRPRIHFKDPITKVLHSQRRGAQAFYYEENQDGGYPQFEGSGKLEGMLQNINFQGVQHPRGSGQRKFSSVAPTGLGEEYHFQGDDLCLRMDNKYFESSQSSCQSAKHSHRSCNGVSGCKRCLRLQALRHTHSPYSPDQRLQATHKKKLNMDSSC